MAKKEVVVETIEDRVVRANKAIADILRSENLAFKIAMVPQIDLVDNQTDD